MAAGALIQFTQGSSAPAGQAMFGNAGSSVSVANTMADPSIVRTVYTLVSVPNKSALVPGIKQDGSLSTWAFTPDVAGDYEVLVECYLSTAAGAPVAYSDQRAFGVKLPVSQRFIPSFAMTGGPIPGHTGTLGSGNFGGDTTGWDKFMEVWLQLLETLAYNIVQQTTATGTVSVGETVREVNFAGGATVTLPLNPSAGQVHRTQDTSYAAGTNNITVNGNGKLIANAATQTIASNGGWLCILYDGAQWIVLSAQLTSAVAIGAPIRLNATSASLQLTAAMHQVTIYLDVASHGAFTALMPTGTIPDGLRLRFKDPNGGWSNATFPTLQDSAPHNIEDPVATGTWPPPNGNQAFLKLVGGDVTYEWDLANTRWTVFGA